MLAADRQAVETDLQAQAVQIKNIEMTNIDRYLQAIGTQAALVCGFAVAQNYCVELSHTTHWFLILGYYLSNTACLVIEFYCIMNSTLVCVLGPTYALNGPTGSMNAAVRSMKEERLTILAAFWYGGVCFAVSEVFAVFITTPLHTSCPSAFMIIAGLLQISRGMERIKKKFMFEDIYADKEVKASGLVTASGKNRRQSSLAIASGEGRMGAHDFIKRVSVDNVV